MEGIGVRRRRRRREGCLRSIASTSFYFQTSHRLIKALRKPGNVLKLYYTSMCFSIFSCPSSSIPTPVIHWLHNLCHSLINGFELHNLCRHSLHNLCRPHQTIPSHIKPTRVTKVHNRDYISQMRPNFTILTKFHNFNQISQV